MDLRNRRCKRARRAIATLAVRWNSSASKGFDTGTSVPQYRNFTITRFDAWRYRVVDEFDNAMIRGYVSYVLPIVDDADHIELNLDASGRTFLLRRGA